MKPIYHHQRCDAAQEFQQSLTQLEDILQTNSTDDQANAELDYSNSISDKISKNTYYIDMAALEDAVADIEQYLEQKHKKLQN